MEWKLRDLLPLCLFSVVLAALSQFTPSPFGKIASIPFAAFLPGYAIVSFLFPKKGFNTVERIFLSLAFSTTTLATLSAFLKYVLGMGVNEINVQPYVAVVVVVFSVLAYLRRLKVDDPYIPPSLEDLKSLIGWYEMSKLHRALTVVLTVALIVSVVAVLYIAITPKQEEKFTEFYILGPNGKACDYPINLVVGEKGKLIIGIVNHEERVVNYTIEVWLVNESFKNTTTVVHHMYFLDRINVTLKPVPVSVEKWRKEWEYNYTFVVKKPGKYKLWFLLFKNGEPFLPKPKKWKDYAGTPVVERIYKAVNGSIQSLNLNVNVRGI